MRKPNFLIVGAEKAGTTSLTKYLNNHPKIYIPQSKEVHYFDENYDKSESWYVSFFRGSQGEQALGEATPFYLYLPYVPRRIYEFNPHMKLIFILRNPIDRAYSKYWHQVTGGLEWLRFREAIMVERDRIKTCERFQKSYSYVDMGQYSNQIERYLKYFPKESMLFLDFADLVNRPQQVVDEVCRFLSLQCVRPFARSEKWNQRKCPLSQRLQLQLNYILNIRRGIYCSNDIGWLWKALTKRNIRWGKDEYPPMDVVTRSMLDSHFASERKRLKELTGLWLQ